MNPYKYKCPPKIKGENLSPQNYQSDNNTKGRNSSPEYVYY